MQYPIQTSIREIMDTIRNLGWLTKKKNIFLVQICTYVRTFIIAWRHYLMNHTLALNSLVLVKQLKIDPVSTCLVTQLYAPMTGLFVVFKYWAKCYLFHASVWHVSGQLQSNRWTFQLSTIFLSGHFFHVMSVLGAWWRCVLPTKMEKLYKLHARFLFYTVNECFYLTPLKVITNFFN